jgi:peptidoglycan/xylan/chitin deacetylase (PgdA/CDA1 family)
MRFSSLFKMRRPVAARRFIFLYHRIASPHVDPFLLAVPRDWFQDHVAILASHCRLVTLDEILGNGAASPTALASITFDDGYIDNLRVASPMLRMAGIPATFFICTGSLGDVRGFWWDRLASAIAATHTPSLDFEPLKELSLKGDLSSSEARRNTTLEIAAKLQRMHPVARDHVVAELEKDLLAKGSGQRELFPVLDEAGVRELGSQPLTQLGAHTHSHPMLSRLAREEQFVEINRSVTTLRDITGVRPRFVAYPYGDEQDYNADSCVSAKDAGLRAAFVNHAARFDPEAEPYRVPRYYVPPLPADKFRLWLRGLFAA